MDFQETGFILKTENYAKCKDFYSQKLGIPVISEQKDWDFKLLKLKFGGSYLLIETGGKAYTPKKGVDRNPSVIRINVKDISLAMEELNALAIEYDFFEFDWGKLVIFYDPDGNQVEIKE